MDDKTSYLVTRKIDIAEKIKKLALEKFIREMKLFDAIEACEDLKEREAQVLTCRYVECLKYKEIAETLNLSIKYVYSLHKSGVEKFCDERS